MFMTKLNDTYLFNSDWDRLDGPLVEGSVVRPPAGSSHSKE